MSLRSVIAAVLTQSAMTGYEITKEFDLVLGYFWKATHQQVYRELGRMTEAGFVRFTVVEQDGRPDKKVYELTDAGRQMFDAWLNETTPPRRVSDPLLVKFFAGEYAGRDTLLRQLGEARAQHKKTLAMYRAIEAEHYPEPLEAMPTWKRLMYMTLRHGIIREESWLEWAAEAERAVKL